MLYILGVCTLALLAWIVRELRNLRADHKSALSALEARVMSGLETHKQEVLSDIYKVRVDASSEIRTVHDALAVVVSELVRKTDSTADRLVKHTQEQAERIMADTNASFDHVLARQANQTDLADMRASVLSAVSGAVSDLVRKMDGATEAANVRLAATFGRVDSVATNIADAEARIKEAVDKKTVLADIESVKTHITDTLGSTLDNLGQKFQQKALQSVQQTTHICSICNRRVWQFLRNSDGTPQLDETHKVICLDCARKGKRNG